MNSTSEFTAAAQLLKEADHVAVVGHVRPDADAIGSVCAVVQACGHLGIVATGWIGQPVPFASNLLSIPGATEISCAAELPECDLVITVDCGSLDRTGLFVKQLQQVSVPIIMVDHHASNNGFGSINLLDSSAESTTTILRQWFRHLELELDQDLAHALYAGLVTDTGSFRWGRPAMHELASELLATGISPRAIAAALIDDISLDGLKMAGHVLSQIEVRTAGQYRVAILAATHDVISGCDSAEVEGLVDYVRGVEGTDIGVVFKEFKPNWFAVSLRTSADIDVSRIAGALGGGGHIRAAGYTVEGTLTEVIADLLAQVATFGEK